MNHPAKYSSALMPVFMSLLEDLPQTAKVLDPFAGTGRIHNLAFDTYGIEIEPEWASMNPRTVCGDSCAMPFESGVFDAICTSPTYGNRMSDHHTAKDGSHRNTYTHILGRKLSENNSGKMPWGEPYRELHRKVYSECARVLKPGGRAIINIKNHIAHGTEVDVTRWHLDEMIRQGFIFVSEHRVNLTGNRFGSNGGARIGFESVLLFRSADK